MTKNSAVNKILLGNMSITLLSVKTLIIIVQYQIRRIQTVTGGSARDREGLAYTNCSSVSLSRIALIQHRSY